MKMQSGKMQSVRGTQDFLPEQSQKYRYIEELAFKVSNQFGFGEIKTPIFEFTDIFHRTLGETSDVINKETYTFTDRGGDSLTLRPEGTAGVARCFISEGLAQNLPLKLYYSGPMFRYERPQKGRFRQFHQLGIEYLGIESHLADLEVISLAYSFLDRLGLMGLSPNTLAPVPRCVLEINTLGDIESRKNYRETLVEYFKKYENELSADSKIRLEKNPLRILDSKDENDKKIIAGAPLLQDYLNESSKAFFNSVLKGLDQLGIKYHVNSKLVRGLDYYSHTVFEFVTTELGAQGTVLAGGRYDGLIEMMGGQKTPGVGWAAGIERLMELLPIEKTKSNWPIIALIPADESGELACLNLAQKLKAKNVITELMISGNVGKKMKRANKIQAHYALIIGESEIQKSEFSLKNLATGEQKNISESELLNLF